MSSLETEKLFTRSIPLLRFLEILHYGIVKNRKASVDESDSVYSAGDLIVHFFKNIYIKGMEVLFVKLILYFSVFLKRLLETTPNITE